MALISGQVGSVNLSTDTSPRVVLDACVLVNFSLCDTLLRLAEADGIFRPCWSEEIILEALRTLELKIGWPPSLCGHFQRELRAHFGEAWIEGYEHLIPQLENDAKDRHVLAAAIHSQTPVILTFNLRDFHPRHLQPWGVQAIHPQILLLELLEQHPDMVLAALRQQAADRRRGLGMLIDLLAKSVPDFAAAVKKKAQL